MTTTDQTTILHRPNNRYTGAGKVIVAVSDHSEPQVSENNDR